MFLPDDLSSMELCLILIHHTGILGLAVIKLQPLEFLVKGLRII